MVEPVHIELMEWSVHASFVDKSLVQRRELVLNRVGANPDKVTFKKCRGHDRRGGSGVTCRLGTLFLVNIQSAITD